MQEKTQEELQEDSFDFHKNNMFSAISDAFKSLNAEGSYQDKLLGFLRCLWEYHLSIRSQSLDEACRIIRRAKQDIISEGFNIPDDDLESLTSKYIANIQKAKARK